jgi:hypothetical protein
VGEALREKLLAEINPALGVVASRNKETGEWDFQDNEEDFEEEIFELDLTHPQLSFYELQCTFPLFVAGMGSGKSKTLALCAVTDAINFPGANIGLYAPTFDLMSLILVPYVSQMLEDGGYEYSYNGQNHVFAIKDRGNIICRSLDVPRRIVGYETFRAHADEIDTLPLDKAEEVWNKIIARNRQKVFIKDEDGNKILSLDDDGNIQYDTNGNKVYQMYKNRVSAYTTPEGWNFAYKRWVENANEEYQYVTASTYSNAHNLPPDYIPNLKKSYPPELIEAYIEGKFTNLKSGRVYRNFDRKLNSSNETVQANDILHIGIDFNIDHGNARIFVDRTVNGELQDHLVDEIVDTYDTDDTIRVIKERYPNHQCFIYPDASGSHRHSGNAGVDSKGQATQTDIWKLQRQPRFTIVVDHTNPAIKDSVASVNARILNGEGKRSLFVNIKKCPFSTKTLEQQTWVNGVPDKSQGLDHGGDCIRYVMHKRHPSIRIREGFVSTRRG